MPARAMKSKYVFSCDEMPKLYIGAPITTMSAACSSAISASLRAAIAACSAVRWSAGVKNAPSDGVVEVRQRFGLQIADDDLRARIRLLQLCGQLVDEQRRVARLASGLPS